MQVMEENEDIAFLYHLVEGYAESSLACHIASLAGLPDELIKRAHQVCANTSLLVMKKCWHVHGTKEKSESPTGFEPVTSQIPVYY